MISVDEYKKKTQETGEDYPLLTLEEFFATEEFNSLEQEIQ